MASLSLPGDFGPVCPFYPSRILIGRGSILSIDVTPSRPAHGTESPFLAGTEPPSEGSRPAYPHRPLAPRDPLPRCGPSSRDLALPRYFDKLFPSPVGIPHIEINGKQQAKPFTF